MFNRGKLKKVVKNVRGKHGTVRRTYYIKQEEAPKKGFLRRHAGKLLAGAAIAGLAYANRHKLAGAARGAGLALNAHKHSGSNASMSVRAKDAFRMAKVGYMNNRGMDIADGAVHRARMAFAGTAGQRLRLQRGGQQALARGQSALRNARANAPQMLQNARGRATEWRRSTGADLAHHLATQGGDVVASHVGSRFGQVAGTALGGLTGGPGGAAVGAWVGGTAGSFLGSRHAAPHIARGASWLADRMRR